MPESTDLDCPGGLIPAWPAPPQVRALQTTRQGGVSLPPFAAFNLGAHVDDDPTAVAANRQRLARHLPAEPRWLEQVHGVRVLDLDGSPADDRVADAVLTRQAGRVCAVLTADCLPVLFCDLEGSVVAAAHAGWRGLAQGVLEATLAALAVPPHQVLAWLGPGIGPVAFEVGAEVRTAFVAHAAAAAAHFRPSPHAPGHYLADLHGLARQRLQACGVGQIHGGGFCTYSDAERFFSFRRDGRTGRMASLIWREA